MDLKKKKKKSKGKSPRTSMRRKKTVRCEGRCPEEEYNRDVCKQMDEAGELD